ncbi:MAG: nicotinate-nucleotide--dimethylbenzimidazole phosphoribosyltransferase [Clostridiales bacterium]|nr:nicotinate-nucleotide--dimethylbenzimidazole phosphoribosyltransferase [Clostridiales bacterium]
MTLNETLNRIQPVDTEAACAAQGRWAQLAKLPGSLGGLETAVSRLAAVQGSAKPSIHPRRTVIFCADNGVTAEGVTPSARSITSAQALNFVRGGGVINAFSRGIGAEVTVVDVGIASTCCEPGLRSLPVRKGTANIVEGPAMTAAECLRAVEVGISLAEECAAAGIRLAVGGEMGVGNTTTAGAVAAVLLNLPPERITVPGAGGSDGLSHKTEVIRRAISCNRPRASSPLDVLARVGGLDIAALCGFYLGCAAHRIAAVLDGVISCAAALCAVRLSSLSRDYLFPSHQSAGPAGGLLLEALGFAPLITAELCLGEGTGAALGVLLLDAALRAYRETVLLADIERPPAERKKG